MKRPVENGVIQEIPDDFDWTYFLASPSDPFMETDLTEVKLAGVKRRLVVFVKSKLAGMNLARLDLTLCQLSDADLTGADLTGATLTQCNFKGAKLSHAKLVKVSAQRAVFYQADLSDADLSGADLRHSLFVEARLDRAVANKASMGRCVLSRASRVGAVLGADLGLADFSDADLSSADFSHASLFRARLHRTRDDKAVFTSRATAHGGGSRRCGHRLGHRHRTQPPPDRCLHVHARRSPGDAHDQRLAPKQHQLPRLRDRAGPAPCSCWRPESAFAAA